LNIKKKLFKNLKRLLIGFIPLIFITGCSYDNESRPDYYLNGDYKVTSPNLPAYQTPFCKLDDNVIECSYLNYAFEIDTSKKYGRDSIVAWDKSQPKNRLKIRFEKMYDQDGTYSINQSINSQNYNVYISIQGDNFGVSNQESFLTSGNMSLKAVPNGWDLVVCDAPFEYRLNGYTKIGNLSTHIVVPL
jgi:hypothetical protein